MTAMPAASMRARARARFMSVRLVSAFVSRYRMTPTAAITPSRRKRKVMKYCGV